LNALVLKHDLLNEEDVVEEMNRYLEM